MEPPSDALLVTLPLLRWFYFVSLGSLGAVVPLLGTRLDEAGLGGARLGWLMAALPVARLVATPLWGWAADRWQVAGGLLRLGCALSLAGVAMVLWAHTSVWAAAGLFLFAVGRAPLGPLVDALCLDALGAHGDYGRVRLWGSVGFLLVVLASGGLADAVGLDPLWLALALSMALLGLSFAFPLRGEGGPAPVLPALRALAREPFLLPFLAAGMLQALALSVYDTFFSAHVSAIGLPHVVTGAAVALGVGAEVLLMGAARPLLARWGAFRLLLAAAALGPVRWALTAVVTDPVGLVAVQALHGITFGAFWIASVQVMAERAPPRVGASAQSLFSTASYGVGALVGALGAGALRDAFGTSAVFWGLAGVSTLATVAAARTLRVDRPESRVRAAG